MQEASAGEPAAFQYVEPAELAELIEAGQVQAIDIRSMGDFYGGHIDGAKSIPCGQIPLRYEEVRTDMDIVLVALKEGRIDEARQLLVDIGIAPERIYVLEGGMNAWEAAGMPLKVEQARRC